ncbi:hypothetical protein PV518_33835 [Streptomyces sp. ND04-05B]|uniref:hypothetical protein n=1 Tax=Streptomyces sp. ND04-05B TaxID=3028693 RepID=UPI0029A1B426|nr:hypothetical protein [Streptomyces sp. ND04-05B]MDX3067100.1 hypothetical protein [Streptomyces sp. ND04-05B]
MMPPGRTPIVIEAPERSPSRGTLLPAGGLLALASGPSLAAGTTQVVQSAPDALAEWVRFGGALIVTLWLAGLAIARTSHGSRQIPQLLGFGLGGAFFLYTTTPASTSLAQHLGDAVYGCALAWLAVEVCRTQGVRLRPGCPVSDAEQRRRTWMVTSLSYLICVIWSFLNAQTVAGLRALGFDEALIVGLDQRSSLGVTTVADGVLAFVRTVAIEDVVIVAAVVTLLTAARRPTWQIYGVVCLVEVALHAYMGAVALTIAMYAAGRVWLYRRYGGVAPLVIGHLVFDLTVLADWMAPASVSRLLAGGLAVAAVYGAAQLWTPRRGGET